MGLINVRDDPRAKADSLIEEHGFPARLRGKRIDPAGRSEGRGQKVFTRGEWVDSRAHTPIIQ